MKLWIRSQDRETLRLAEMLDIYELEDDEEKRFVIEESGVDIGCYKSKERALEVLDEIQRMLQPKIIINNTSDDSLPIIDGEWVQSIKAEMNYDIKELSTVVYEMPKE